VSLSGQLTLYVVSQLMNYACTTVAPVGLAPRVTLYRITGESDLSLGKSAAIPTRKNSFYLAVLEALKLRNFFLHIRNTVHVLSDA